MIGFSIMMWFLSIILSAIAVALLRGNKGNVAGVHGKVWETTKDKVGYGKALGKVLLFMGIGILCCGVIALFRTSAVGIRNAMIVLLAVIAISACLLVRIQKKFGYSNK